MTAHIAANDEIVGGHRPPLQEKKRVVRHPSFVVVQKPHHFGYYTQYPSWFLNREELLSCYMGANPLY